MPNKLLQTMTDLIIVASRGTGTLPHVKKVIAGDGWEQVFVIGPLEFIQHIEGEVNKIEINPQKYLSIIRDDIIKGLMGRVRGLEVGLNIISGTGKEHMAVFSALLKLGIGFRLVALTQEGIKEV